MMREIKFVEGPRITLPFAFSSRRDVGNGFRQRRIGMERFDGARGGVSRVFFPLFLILMGVYFLLSNLGYIPSVTGSLFWPLLLIAIGLSMLFKKKDGGWCCPPWKKKEEGAEE